MDSLKRQEQFQVEIDLGFSHIDQAVKAFMLTDTWTKWGGLDNEAELTELESILNPEAPRHAYAYRWAKINLSPAMRKKLEQKRNERIEYLTKRAPYTFEASGGSAWATFYNECIHARASPGWEFKSGHGWPATKKIIVVEEVGGELVDRNGEFANTVHLECTAWVYPGVREHKPDVKILVIRPTFAPWRFPGGGPQLYGFNGREIHIRQVKALVTGSHPCDGCKTDF